jgi:alternative squalene epoxidase
MEVLSALALWVNFLTVPLFFSFGKDRFEDIFPREWYVTAPTDYWMTGNYPSPVGLCLGLLAVVVGQVGVLVYFYCRRNGMLGSLTPIQKEGPRKYDFMEGMITHLSQPEGFVILGSYLIGTWMIGLMPSTYYSFAGGINPIHVFMQLLSVDFFQTVMHYLEHKVSPYLYQISHKPHHRFTNPRLFDAFDGSLADTVCMILLPLYITAHLVPSNVWSYMAFGSTYANWLVLIHSEYHHIWDEALFQHIGFGTAGDHHVHHKLFIFNYAHLFSYWDRLFGTYKSPSSVEVFTLNTLKKKA